MTETFDYIIVGGGSAGCVLAARLSEDPATSVCLLEAGPSDWHPMIHIPVGWMKLMKNKTFNWMYETEPSDWSGGRRVPVPRGKTLGGSSSINGNVFNRGTPGDFDHWAQRGNIGWGYADVLPLFKKLEDWSGPNPGDLRGRGGPLPVTATNWTHPLVEAFMDGCESMGIPRNPDYNGARQEGVSYTQRTIKGGRRQSAARAFLRPALKRANLAVKTGAQATAVIFEAKRAVGVRHGRHGAEVRARREVILCGGVINSPQLLQLSGIGDPAHLAEIGVPLVHALPGVGMNLRDHYTPRFTARVKNAETFNERVRGLPFAQEVVKWLMGKPSVLSLPATVSYAFARSHPALEVNDLQITFMPASYREGNQSALDDQPGMTIAAWQQRPDSLGFVRARSADPFEKPMIQPNYLAEASDRAVLLAGLKLARAILRSAPMAPFFGGEIYPGDGVITDEELMQTARDRGTTTFHMMGACRMGPAADPTAVVDHALRVRGVDGLRVADASIMPTMPSANTNAATLMIGEKAAQLIRDAR
jgi:choline dehydrogenase